MKQGRQVQALTGYFLTIEMLLDKCVGFLISGEKFGVNSFLFFSFCTHQHYNIRRIIDIIIYRKTKKEYLMSYSEERHSNHSDIKQIQHQQYYKIMNYFIKLIIIFFACTIAISAVSSFQTQKQFHKKQENFDFYPRILQQTQTDSQPEQQDQQQDEQQESQQVQILKVKSRARVKSQISKKKDPNQKLTAFPCIIWRFSNDNSNINLYLDRLIRNNIKQFTKKSKCILRTITGNTPFYDHLSKSSQTKIAQILSKPNYKHNSTGKTALRNYFIKLYTLFEYGGVWVGSDVFLYQDLLWLNHLNQNPYVINKHFGLKTEVFTYFSEDYRSKPNKDELHDGEYYPTATIHDSLIASVPQAKLIEDWLSQFISLQEELSHFHRYNTKQLTLDQVTSLYQESIRIVLERAESKLKKEKSILHASHYYGLRQMNFMLFGARIKYFSNQIIQKEINMLTEMNVEYMEFMSGPFTYSQQLQPGLIQQFSRQTDGFTDFTQILLDQKSIFSTYLLFHEAKQHSLKRSFTEKQIQAEQDKLSQIKLQIPKIVWMYWQTGYESMDIFHKMCVNNIKHFAKASGYKAVLVSDSTLSMFLNEDNYKIYSQTLANLRIRKAKTTKSDMARIALLYEHGGIYIDVSVMITQDFNWIQDIPQNKFTIGRNSAQTPEAFLWFGGADYFRQFSNRNDLMFPYLPYPVIQNNFMAGMANATIFRQLFFLFYKFIDTNFIETVNFVQQNNIMHHPLWLSEYFLQYISFQTLIQLKQRQLDKEQPGKLALHHYGIYMLDVRAGPYKISHNMYPYDDHRKMVTWLMQTDADYVEGIFGQFRYMSKFHHLIIVPLNREFNQIMENKLETAKGSAFQKFMLLLNKNKKLIGYDWVN